MSTPHLIDVHTHTQFAAFKDDQDAVIRRALDAGVWMINVGTQRDTSVAAITTAERFSEGVYATVGLHPIHTDKSYHDAQELGVPAVALAKEGSDDNGFTSRGEEFDYGYYKKLAQRPKVIGIGECGLDYFRLTEDTKKKQTAIFEQQIALSQEINKPLMIHCRNAFDDLIHIIQNTQYNIQDTPGVIHFFSGTIDHARKLLNMGFSFSFGGVITFARDYDEVVQYIPLERIVLETDAPYITPMPYRGKRNEPLYVQEVAKKIAELKKLRFEQISEQTTKNAKEIFGIA